MRVELVWLTATGATIRTTVCCRVQNLSRSLTYLYDGYRLGFFHTSRPVRCLLVSRCTTDSSPLDSTVVASQINTLPAELHPIKYVSFQTRPYIVWCFPDFRFDHSSATDVRRFNEGGNKDGNFTRKETPLVPSLAIDGDAMVK